MLANVTPWACTIESDSFTGPLGLLYLDFIQMRIDIRLRASFVLANKLAIYYNISTMHINTACGGYFYTPEDP
jgi:hypothetical protein